MINTQINIDIAEGGWLDELPNIEKISEDIFAKVIAELNPEWLNGKKSVSCNYEWRWYKIS